VSNQVVLVHFPPSNVTSLDFIDLD